jgi:hypothetical protein
MQCHGPCMLSGICACDLAAAGAIKVHGRCVYRSRMVGAPHSNCDIIRVPSQPFYFIAAGMLSGTLSKQGRRRPLLYKEGIFGS